MMKRSVTWSYKPTSSGVYFIHTPPESRALSKAKAHTMVAMFGGHGFTKLYGFVWK